MSRAEKTGGTEGERPCDRTFKHLAAIQLSHEELSYLMRNIFD